MKSPFGSVATRGGSRAPGRSRLWYATLIVFLLGAKGDGKGCCDKRPEDTGEEVVDIQTPDVELQVTSIDPASGEPDTRFDVRVYGAGFDAGARVHFSDRQGLNARTIDGNTLSVTVPGLPVGVYDVIVTNPDGVRATLRRGLNVESSVDCSFLRVYFEFDKAQLVPDAESAIDELLPCYQSTSSQISAEGHADERGTVEYNLALGQRRADAVQRYLTTHGVSSSKVRTVSYGEERPVDPAHNETAWAQNRRVDIHAGN